MYRPRVLARRRMRAADPLHAPGRSCAPRTLLCSIEPAPEDPHVMYEKLVRDGIPEVIARDGFTPVTRTVTGNALRDSLHAKLSEEAAGFQQEPSAEELADILEVLRALSGAYGIDWAEVEAFRMSKRAERGGFDKGIYLVEARPSD